MKLSGSASVPSEGLRAQPAILHYSALPESALFGASFASSASIGREVESRTGTLRRHGRAARNGAGIGVGQDLLFFHFSIKYTRQIQQHRGGASRTAL